MSVVKNIPIIEKNAGNIKLFKNNFNVGQKKNRNVIGNRGSSISKTVNWFLTNYLEYSCKTNPPGQFANDIAIWRKVLRKKYTLSVPK